jgi:hypothetical protein
MSDVATVTPELLERLVREVAEASPQYAALGRPVFSEDEVKDFVDYCMSALRAAPKLVREIVTAVWRKTIKGARGGEVDLRLYEGRVSAGRTRGAGYGNERAAFQHYLVDDDARYLQDECLSSGLWVEGGQFGRSGWTLVFVETPPWERK